MPEYTVEVDSICKPDWEQLIRWFDDANFYQTWSHGSLKWDDNLSHLLLKQDGSVVAAAQVTLVKIPLARVGMAHIRFGPMWRRKDRPQDATVYARILRALRDEYRERRGLVVRLKPWEDSSQAANLTAIRNTEGFSRQSHIETYNTFVLDLSHSLDALYQGLARKWRNDLRKAQAQHMTIEESTALDAVDVFLSLYREMHSRKAFVDTTDIKLIRAIQGDLPAGLKTHVMVCRYADEPVAAILFSLIGDKALALFGATSERGRKLGASYLVNWSVVSWLKEQGSCRWYDLVGGLSTPSIRHFKAGLTKRCGEEVHMGDYDSARGFFAPRAIRCGDRIRPVYQQLKSLSQARFRRDRR